MLLGSQALCLNLPSVALSLFISAESALSLSLLHLLCLLSLSLSLNLLFLLSLALFTALKSALKRQVYCKTIRPVMETFELYHHVHHPNMNVFLTSI